MQHLGEINNRQVFYIKVDADESWLEELPTETWLAIPIGDEKDIEAYSKLADNCLDKNVVYVCSLGQACELIHDIFDETIVWKEVLNDDILKSWDDSKSSPMTTWHNNFDEGFWFALHTAYPDNRLIEKIVCIDYTTMGVKNYLVELMNQFHESY